jgi:hypothetical protein
MCAPLFYTTHPPTVSNCWWVGSHRDEASTHKSLGGPQCPENYSARDPHPHRDSEHYFPTKTFVTRIQNIICHKKGLVIPATNPPLVQDLVGTLVPAPPPHRLRSFSFALHRDSAQSLPCSFTGQQQQHLRRQVGGPQCPEIFSGMSTVLHRVYLPWKHPRRRIELVFQMTCPTGARLGAVRLWKDT